jgi:hypothetical protein
MSEITHAAPYTHISGFFVNPWFLTNGMRMPNINNDRESWLFPAIVAAVVALLTTAVTGSLQHLKDNAEDRREVVRIRAEILKAAGDSKSLLVAKLLLDHVLTPIDRSDDRDKFANKVTDYIATLATETSTGTGGRAELPNVAPDAIGDIHSLVKQFDGPGRLSASNTLVELAQTNKPAVVSALVSGLRPVAEKSAYRINLYIVFTLGRLSGGWQGTPEQIERIRSLKSTSFAKDSTFRARLQEALDAISTV